ncbi:MAG TPA: alkaline phosphatase family protein [Xanthobacteraceae bacterium]|nr:alkaline phosphatase family protein [Xanthobacteraceae bacterium]
MKHIIVVMQENHSFDNYFGVLAYVPGGVYHPVRGGHDDDGDHGDRDSGRDSDDRDAATGCHPDDHRCVDGLACGVAQNGTLSCSNANIASDGTQVFAFHNTNRCVNPDLDHGWFGTHREANFARPNASLKQFLGDGFVRQNEPADGSESRDETMGYYTQAELPFYYDLAQKFAISDRHFSSVLGPTFPNRSYSYAATSFGHVTTNDEIPPLGGYKPLTGTIFDLLEAHAVTWANYFQDVPSGGSFRLFTLNGADPHFLPYSLFLAQVSGVPGVPALPSVSFVDPNFGFFARRLQNDEHPSADIQRGQAFVSQLVNAVRNGPYWKDSIIFITYDEHGGFYDHVRPPRAPQGGTRTPDGIEPGQCADASMLPASARPGGGAQCSTNQVNPAGNSVATAAALCPAFAANPTGPFPKDCASFDQLGFRVPLIAVSPFAKPHHVSHEVSDHTSVLALIEKRFLTPFGGDPDRRPHLTRRDQFASTLEALFDFENAPSLNTTVGTAAPPLDDCGPF